MKDRLEPGALCNATFNSGTNQYLRKTKPGFRATFAFRPGIIYTNSVQMMANVVDWTLEDRSLLGIRARGHFNRTLPPMQFELFGSKLSNAASQAVVEYLNYGFAVMGIFIVFLIHRSRMTRLRTRYSAWLAGGEA